MYQKCFESCTNKSLIIPAATLIEVLLETGVLKPLELEREKERERERERIT